MPREVTFGSYIRNARQKQKLRVRDVAALMDVSDAIIYRWETDQRRPTDANLSALCKVLNLPIKAMREMVDG